MSNFEHFSHLVEVVVVVIITRPMLCSINSVFFTEGEDNPLDISPDNIDRSS